MTPKGPPFDTRHSTLDIFRVLLAFLTRDWRIRRSYRVGLFVSIGHILFAITSCFFLGKLIDPHDPHALAPYGGAYFPFVLLGLAGSRYVTTNLSLFAGNLREEQLQGTLEAMLTTPTSIWAIVLGGAVWEFLWSAVEITAYVVLGVSVFGVDLGHMNVLASLVVLGLTLLALSSLGVLSASGMLLFKEFDPVTWLVGGIMRLVGGGYFPVSLLPAWLGALASALPLTYALEGLRQAVLMGRSLGELRDVCLALSLFAALAWPLALASFAWTLKRLKATGTLSFR